MALIRVKGFIDPHVHLREPEATHKEDFYAGSRAALKGGFTFILDMPNNPLPTISIERLQEKIRSSDEKALIDIGFNYGTNGWNVDTFERAWNDPRVFGLKLYCDHTTGEMLVEDDESREKIFREWRSSKPILIHAEGEQLENVVELGARYGRRVHICHVSTAYALGVIRAAKKEKMALTAGTCPHYLFMTDVDREKKKGYATMRPPLGTKNDQDAIWSGIADRTLDLIETDHAPHSREEKENDPPAFGVTGLETAAGLMFKAVKEGMIAQEDISRLLRDRARSIFNIPEQPDTYIELDPDEPYVSGEDGYETKCGWSPFDRWELYGRVQTAVVKGRTLLSGGRMR